MFHDCAHISLGTGGDTFLDDCDYQKKLNSSPMDALGLDG